MLIIQQALFLLFRYTSEIALLVLKPLLIPLLKRISYQNSLIPDGPFLEGGVLIHAASLGEVNAVKSLVNELTKHIVPEKIGITTTTVAGFKAASSIDPRIRTRLSVLDIASLRRRQLRAISPRLICIVETEIWPNLLNTAREMGIRVLFLNARLSKKSVKGLSPLKPLLDSIGSSIVGILAKSNEDADRFRQLFSVPVRIAGNLKFAIRPDDFDQELIRKHWGFSTEDVILCAGSTRPGEEVLLLAAYNELAKSHEALKLILAPRHPQRIGEILKLLCGYDYKLVSQNPENHSKNSILILDELGHLNKAYSICDLAIIGGSFFDFGGHNPLEPAYYGKAICMGPYHSSCRESVHELEQANAIYVCERQQLCQALDGLISDQQRRDEMGARAKQVLNMLKNTLNIHLDEILKWIN